MGWDDPEKRKVWETDDRRRNPDKYRLKVAKSAAKRRGHAPPQISLSELKQKRESHSGMCDICGLLVNPLFVDHCHQTGDFRGFLCRRCNLLLGFHESRTIDVESMNRYLGR